MMTMMVIFSSISFSHITLSYSNGKRPVTRVDFAVFGSLTTSDQLQNN